MHALTFSGTALINAVVSATRYLIFVLLVLILTRSCIFVGTD